ncbi:MAG: Cytosine-specific methyltransferase [Sphingomonadales bacterium]|nr:Cytosine-specific methyltransferase [Sphingomonadales bacterium]
MSARPEPTYDAVDDFAGPGGWDEGARMVGLTTIGYEWDQSACDTAAAAGHAREKVDVSLHSLAEWAVRGVRRIRGYIGSPPCTLFSAAGSGVGKLVIDVLARGIRDLFAGNDTRATVREMIYPVTLAEARAKDAKRPADKKWSTEKIEQKARNDAFVAALVLEPARRISELDPEWVALEQVPEVLPLWQVYVQELRALGYSAWTGVLCAADYGVPQTRRRAVVMASRTRIVNPPEPTHSEAPGEADLFGNTTAKWVTLAVALGWPDEAEIVPARGAGMVERHGNRPAHPATEPSPTLISKSRSWSVRTGQNTSKSGGVQMYERRLDEPAPTVTGTVSNWRLAERWAYDRPATTVVGSFKPEVIAAPGYRTTESRQNAEGSVTVTVTEAGVIQSFPADYPWQGSRSKKFQQVGNAVPPLMAAHVLAALTGREIRQQAAA